MLTQRANTATAPRLIYARHRGVCKCGRGFLAGEQIEFDPIGRHKRCALCIQKRQSQNNGVNGQVIHFDSYRSSVQRLKQIDNLPRPLQPHIVNEYWALMREVSTAPETSKSVKQFLQSTARCSLSNDEDRFAVSLLEDKPCVHCFTMQKRGDLVLMDFPNRNVHCIWCECTHL
jgi:hypothetical protein